MVRRQSLNNGADQHLNQSAAHGIDRHRQKQPRIGRQQARQHPQSHQTGRTQDMGRHNAGLIAQTLRIPCRQHIHQNLDTKVVGHQESNLRHRDMKFILENNKKQRCQIVDNGLGDIAQVAGIQGSAITAVHV